MAVIFGRIGTTRVSGGARLVCTPDSQIAAPPAGPDVTPNPVNWNDVAGTTSGNTNTQTISGIDTTITLNVLFAGIQDNYTIFKNNTSIGGLTFTVSNNDTIYFSFNTAGVQGKWNATATVENVTDNNTVLDTFTINLTGEGGGGGIGGGGGA